jgi:hypothetical protein
VANIRRWLEDAEQSDGETIEAIVVGIHQDMPSFNTPTFPDEHVVLSREAGLAKLDVDFDDFEESANCYPMYAWTQSHVYFIAEYEGATSLARVPRHPVACAPAFSGNGEQTS